MTRALSNSSYAARMRSNRGEPPKRLGRGPVRMQVWRRHHKDLPEEFRPSPGFENGFVVMLECDARGAALPDARFRAVHESHWSHADEVEVSDDGPDIWQVTFRPGCEPSK